MLILEILIVPSLTLCLGPLGPSGVIPIETLAFNVLIIFLILEIVFFSFSLLGLFVDPRMELKPWHFIRSAIISPSLCLDIKISILFLVCHVNGESRSWSCHKA